MEWLEKLQAPGLILAGVVIYLLFRIILLLLEERRDLEKARQEQAEKAVVALAENTKTTARMAAILDLVCKRMKQ